MGMKNGRRKDFIRFLPAGQGDKTETLKQAALPPETLKLFNFYLKNKTIINLLNYKIMRKIFLFLFAAVLSIGTAMAEVVTITGDDCALEYTVEDGRALIITGTYLEQHSFELTLVGELDMSEDASFVCDMQMMKIGEFGSVAWADEGTATVTIYHAAIGITATGLFDSAGDDQNTYNLEDVLAFPKSSAGGDDIAVDGAFTVDMPNLVATMDPALTFTASGEETGMPLGTVQTYLECDWNGVFDIYCFALMHARFPFWHCIDYTERFFVK